MSAFTSVNVSPNTGENLTTLVPAGCIIQYGGATAPAGWLMCDGSPVSRSVYSALFQTIGLAFGAGDGSTTFNLPNTSAKTIRGVDGAVYLRGAIGGADTATLTADNLPQHRHQQSKGGDVGAAGAGAAQGTQDNVGGGTTLAGRTLLEDGTTLATNSAFSIVNSYLSLNFIIKY